MKQLIVESPVQRKYITLYRNPASRKEIAIEVIVLETKQKENKPLRSLALVQPVSGFGELWVDADCIMTRDEVEDTWTTKHY